MANVARMRANAMGHPRIPAVMKTVGTLSMGAAMRKAMVGPRGMPASTIPANTGTMPQEQMGITAPAPAAIMFARMPPYPMRAFTRSQETNTARAPAMIMPTAQYWKSSTITAALLM